MMTASKGSVWRTAMDRTREALSIQRGATPPSESNFSWARFFAIEARMKAAKRAKDAERKRLARRAEAAAAGRIVRPRASLAGMDANAVAARKAEQNRQHQAAYRARKSSASGHPTAIM